LSYKAYLYPFFRFKFKPTSYSEDLIPPPFGDLFTFEIAKKDVFLYLIWCWIIIQTTLKRKSCSAGYSNTKTGFDKEEALNRGFGTSIRFIHILLLGRNFRYILLT